MQVGSATETGLVRSRNEDALLVAPEHRVFAVADGMGGHPAGDVASQLTIRTIAEQLDGFGHDPEGTLVGVLDRAHRALLNDMRREPSRQGMGTTAVVTHLRGDDAQAVIAHVGDSRAYLSRDGQLSQVTTDHSGFRGRITQALGGFSDGVAPDVVTCDLAPGDRLLLCTDGLTDMLDDREIADILAGDVGAQEACDRLVDAALARGGIDNVTVVVVDV